MNQNRVDKLFQLYEKAEELELNFTWASEKTEVRKSNIDTSGYGRFAKETIEPGEIVIIAGGPILDWSEYKQTWPYFNGRSGLQIENKFVIEQASRSSFLRGTINHSCSPNVIIEGQIVFKAWKRIEKNEELSLDYSTFLDEDAVSIWNCNCKTDGCRKVITAKDWLLPELRNKYDKHFSSFILNKIEKLNDAIIYQELSNLSRINISKVPLLQSLYNQLK